MPRFALDLELDGRAFAGTQWQKGQRTVQAELLAAVAGLDGQERHVRLVSRLDSGVDAEHLPCDVELARAWDPAVLCQALTDRLPADLAVRRAAIVPDGFNAIADAIGKTYRYRIALRPVRPVRDPRCWWLRRLDRTDPQTIWSETRTSAVSPTCATMRPTPRIPSAASTVQCGAATARC